MVLLCYKKSKLFVYFCLCHATWDLVLQPGIKSMPLHWKHGGQLLGHQGSPSLPQIKFYVVKLVELFLIPYLKYGWTRLLPL